MNMNQNKQESSHIIRASLILLLFLSFYISPYYGYFTPVNRPAVPTRDTLDCVYFSGAGIYFWWQAGCAKYIQKNCDLENVSILGASAGSLTSSLLLSGVDFDYAAESAFQLANEFGVYENKNTFVFWGPILKNWLEKILPNDLSPAQLNQLKIAITPASPFQAPKLVSGFHSKKDLIEALMASCHVPLLLDGKPFTEYRGEKYLDGSFWYFVTKDRYTGLPLAADTNPKDVFWVDYCDDEAFMQSISGNILETVSPDTIKNMIASGYRFMESEHAEGRLPIAKSFGPLQMQKLLSRTMKSSSYLTGDSCRRATDTEQSKNMANADADTPSALLNKQVTATKENKGVQLSAAWRDVLVGASVLASSNQLYSLAFDN